MRITDGSKLSGVDYFKEAEKILKGKKGSLVDLPFVWSDGRIHDGVDQQRIDALLDPSNWSDILKAEGCKPRVYMDVDRNGKGNLEVRWAGGGRGIFYKSDFNVQFALWAEHGAYGAHRSQGELMWVKGFSEIPLLAYRHPELSEVLVAGFRVRVNELAATLAAGVDLVGHDSLVRSLEGGFNIQSSLSGEALQEARKVSSQTAFEM